MPRGQQVDFQCETAGWFPQPSLGWSLDDLDVHSSLFSSSSSPAGDAFNSSSRLSFQAAGSTNVKCWASLEAVGAAQSRLVVLSVGEEAAGFGGQRTLLTLRTLRTLQ